MLRISNLKNVLAVLQAIKCRSGNKHQFCTLVLGSEGLSLRWEDDAKSLQSSVFLKPNIFEEFRCQDPRRVVGLSLTTLMDTMAVFSSSAAPLEVPPPTANCPHAILLALTALHFSSSATSPSFLAIKCMLYGLTWYIPSSPSHLLPAPSLLPTPPNGPEAGYLELAALRFSSQGMLVFYPKMWEEAGRRELFQRHPFWHQLRE